MMVTTIPWDDDRNESEEDGTRYFSSTAQLIRYGAASQ